jgi:hypothetical protein
VNLLICFATILLLACSAFAAAPVAATPSYRITGVVISSVDKNPLPHVHLNAVPTSDGRMGGNFVARGAGFNRGIEVDSDEHGRFALTVPSPGRWRLMAGASGFVTQAYNEHDGYSSAVVLTDAAPTINLRFQLAPEAQVAGTVLDEAGEPVRDAHVMLQRRPFPSPDREQQEFRNRMTAQTDDRGVYEFSGLAEGDYRIMVDAKPWYSVSGQSQVSNTASPIDPALDVTYQLTWYPGVDDPAEAEVLSLHSADNRRADFHLSPVPAVHLRFPVPASANSTGRPVPFFPVLERVGVGTYGMGTFNQGSSFSTGQLELGGLAPGLYRMRIPGSDREGQTRLIEIAPGTSRIVDATTVALETANLTIETDPGGEERDLGIELRNVESGARFTAFGGDAFFRSRSSENQQSTSRPVVIQVPPGRYEVRVTGKDAYLLGIAAKGAEISGHFVTVHAGDGTLRLRTGRGRASINGIVVASGKPVEGALVILVPAGLDNPGSFASVVKDQTNTDGSFDLNNIVPGQYILIAVSRGWQVNWEDSATLQRYLTQGIPLDLHAEAHLKQEITVQEP